MTSVDAADHWAAAHVGYTPPPWLHPHASTLPATGAWRPGDPFGQRQFMRMAVDRSFVLGAGADLNDRAIVEGLLSMSDRMGICIVAEGVETREQLDWLVESGCGHAQGWYFAPAAPVDEVPAVLALLGSA